MRGDFEDPAAQARIDWRTHRTLAGFGAFGGIGFLGGLFGLGAGFANVPALNLLMAAPLKVAVGSSGLIISIINSSAAWVYIHRGALLPLLAVPAILGVMLGSRIGARLLAVTPAGDRAARGGRRDAARRRQGAAEGTGHMDVSGARRRGAGALRALARRRHARWASPLRSSPFVLYVSGAMPAYLPLEALPRYWGLPVERVPAPDRRALPAGAGCAASATRTTSTSPAWRCSALVTAAVLPARSFPILLRLGERLQAALAIAQIVVLLRAAVSGFFAGG